MKTNVIHIGNCLEVLKTLPDNSINTCVTSPPYWGLRDYGMADQLGQEKTPEEFVANMVQVFREVKRVLREDGTLWLNLGDSYLPNKQLAGIPWQVAFALQADGWVLRSDIIWNKPNPMPESVTDRCTKSHEYIFMFSKTVKYYYDHEAIKEESVYPENRPSGVERNRIYGYDSKENNNPEAYKKSTPRGGFNSKTNHIKGKEAFKAFKDLRNKRTVWTINTGTFPGAHFATYPPELITDCIKAGCPVGGIVLDPFFGSGTTGEVAERLDRKWIGIELNPTYAALAEKRTAKVFPLFKQNAA